MSDHPIPADGLPVGANLPNQPLPITAVVIAAFTMLKTGFGRTALLAALSAAAGTVPDLLLADVKTVEDVTATDLLLILASGVGYLLFFAAMIDSLGASAMGRETGVTDHLRTGGRRALAMFFGMFFYGAAVLLGALLFILPGVWAAIAFTLFVYPLVLEDESATDAMKQSFTLTRSEWFRTGAFWLIAVGIVALCTVIAVQLFPGVTSDAGVIESLPSLLLLQVAIGALVTPVFYAILLLGWHDLRLRYAATLSPPTSPNPPTPPNPPNPPADAD